MWKEKLPNNCPPSTAEELNIDVYRILLNKEPAEEDFQPYIKKFPNNKRYKSLCKAYAISSFDTIENAFEAWKGALIRGKNIGSFIGSFSISNENGQSDFSPKSGHYSTWLYESVECDTFVCNSIIEINEN